MRNDLITRLTILVIAVSVAGHGSLATNAVWEITVPSFTGTNLTAPEAFASLEKASQRIDPSGRGIRVVVAPRWEGDMKMTWTSTNLSLRRLVDFLANGRDVFIVDDVALVCDRQEQGQSINHVAPLSVRVTDATTKVLITNAMVTSSDFRPPEGYTRTMKVNSDGYFDTTITYMVRRPKCYGLTVWTEDDDTPELLISAPGYEDRKLRVFLGDGDQFVPQSVDVTLVPKHNGSNTTSHGTALPRRP